MTEEFIERLAAARIGATYNFYRDGERAALLRERLAAYLEARAGAPVLLVAEAPGYRGTRVSGIPLTSERQLTGAGPAEATATVVHSVLAELGARGRRAALECRADPSRATSARTARRRAPRSRPACRSHASWPVGRRVVPVGRVAHGALGGTYVRHPAHGGGPEFRRGLRAAARVTPRSPQCACSGGRARLPLRDGPARRRPRNGDARRRHRRQEHPRASGPRSS